ncbi:MAG: VRR-NUC domain-containing protein [Bacteroidota bacterium]
MSDRTVKGRLARLLASRELSEMAIQRAVIKHLEARAVADLVWFHPANGEARHPVTAAKLSGMGVVAGIPDLILIVRGRVFALELKSLNGRISKVQLAMHERLRAAGVTIAVSHGLDQAIAQLEAWNLLRKTVYA